MLVSLHDLKTHSNEDSVFSVPMMEDIQYAKKIKVKNWVSEYLLLYSNQGESRADKTCI